MKQKLLEQEGLDTFLAAISDKHPNSVYIMSFLNDFIKKSNCKKIEFTNFSINASGASLHDRVLINYNLLNIPITNLLYVIFHEIAHQYQYKKYGIDKMYDVYTDKIDVKDAAIFMRNVELIADEFAVRKLRELEKKSNKVKINSSLIKKVYDNIPLSHFESMISHFKKIIKDSGLTDKVEISEILYNQIKKG